LSSCRPPGFLALGRSQLPQPYAWFDFDNYAGTYQATRWLIEKGHQRIALLGESNNQAFITQRRQGYLDALREAGLSSEWLRAMPPSRRVGMPPRKNCFPAATAYGHHYRLQHPRRRRGDGAGAAGAFTGDNAVSLVVYDGLPQDSIVDTDVASVIQSTRQGVGNRLPIWCAS
jgi:LacI family transcriptional regulator